MSKCFFHFWVRYLDFSHDPCHDTYELKGVVKRLGEAVVLPDQSAGDDYGR